LPKIILLQRDVRQLRELHGDLGADRVFVKRRSRLGSDCAEQREEMFLVHVA
jgi:hypothetical protein